MTDKVKLPEQLEQRDVARLIMDFFHRLVIHHVFWFSEAEHQLGREEALSILGKVYKKSFDVQLNRLSNVLGYSTEDGIPTTLLQMDKDQLKKIREAVAVNWLANDGIWFQSVEFSRGMNDAKRLNDSCWARFSPFEAWSIKRFLDLPENPGIEGLKQALSYRLYAAINQQTITEESPDGFVFKMVDCRVQSARKRKNLPDYPCKTGGLVEYTSFAESIDPRIKTECIGCPPDPHPEDWYCAWRFTIPKDNK